MGRKLSKDLFYGPSDSWSVVDVFVAVAVVTVSVDGWPLERDKSLDDELLDSRGGTGDCDALTVVVLIVGVVEDVAEDADVWLVLFNFVWSNFTADFLWISVTALQIRNLKNTKILSSIFKKPYGPSTSIGLDSDELSVDRDESLLFAFAEPVDIGLAKVANVADDSFLSASFIIISFFGEFVTNFGADAATTADTCLACSEA